MSIIHAEAEAVTAENIHDEPASPLGITTAINILRQERELREGNVRRMRDVGYANMQADIIATLAAIEDMLTDSLPGALS